jgi:cyclophilin family peptidyl-prolyl cis-trans isomerase
VVAYGIANLDEPLTREGSYLPDGIFADMSTTSGKRVIVGIDYENAPLQAAHFIRMIEGPSGPPQGRGRGAPPIGTIETTSAARIDAVIDSRIQRSVAVRDLPLDPNPAVSNDGSGLFGLSGPASFFLSTGENVGLDGEFTVLGRIVAGAHVLGDIAAGDQIRSVRILRSGEAATEFRTDNEAFQTLLRGR